MIYPDDWKEPDWDKRERVHCWRNYISEPVRLIWWTFTKEQKQALAEMLQEVADAEHWE